TVLFLCTGNSARSQMAEALTRDRSGGAVEAYSAGSRPKPLHPTSERVRGVCPESPGKPEAVHWNIPDPAAGQADDDASYPAFQQTASELDTRIGFLLAVLTDRAPAQCHT